MRLLNVTTFRVEDVEPGSEPRYAAFSHRWTEQEVSFHEIATEVGKQKQGFEKIKKCCDVARNDGLTHIWVDTCCIDKRSSTELSEAISSMFRWYAGAEICYAFLMDATGIEDFIQSSWFDRGWTLQELIAPPLLIHPGSSNERGQGPVRLLRVRPTAHSWSANDYVIRLSYKIVDGIHKLDYGIMAIVKDHPLAREVENNTTMRRRAEVRGQPHELQVQVTKRRRFGKLICVVEIDQMRFIVDGKGMTLSAKLRTGLLFGVWFGDEYLPFIFMMLEIPLPVPVYVLLYPFMMISIVFLIPL